MSNTFIRGDRHGSLGPDGWEFENDTCRIIPTTGNGLFFDIVAKHGLYCVLDCHTPENVAGSPTHKFIRENEEILNILKVMSHDIRGPLTSLAAALKLLKRGAYGKMDKTVSYEIDQLFIVVRGLIGTLEEFLGRAFSINDGIEMSQERLHLNREVVQPVLLEFSEEIRSRSITVKEHLDPFSGSKPVILGDRFWLKAIFRNLIRNAIKYGGKRCRITIGFDDLGFQFKMNVHNTGKPVPEEFRDRLFTKFGRISSKDNGSSEGMGLGLFLVKQIIERHGGHIWYEATENGSNFLFTLLKN